MTYMRAWLSDFPNSRIVSRHPPPRYELIDKPVHFPVYILELAAYGKNNLEQIPTEQIINKNNLISIILTS